jgi:V-type H+-transporting ATPase subunit G
MRDAESKLIDIKNAGKKSGNKIIAELLKAVTDVTPEVPNRVTAPPVA